MKALKKNAEKSGGAKSSQYRVYVIKDRCKGCQFCIEFCPQKALSRSTEINSHGYHIVHMENGDRCTGCGMCSMVCPEFAINVVQAKEDSRKRR